MRMPGSGNTQDWYVSSERMTFSVTTDGGKIISAAPIARSFVGQPLDRLIAWMQRQGGLRYSRLPSLSTCAQDRKEA